MALRVCAFGVSLAFMGLILNIETATTNCSVSVAKNGKQLAVKEHDTPSYSHSEQLHVFIKEVINAANISFSDLDAISVSKGPGSYTGLRIGVSTAKGLCFSLDIPLISIPTLESMVQQRISDSAMFVIPVLDARRMEVYSAVYDNTGKEVRETEAEIIDENSFQEFVTKGKVVLLGNGATKCEGELQHSNFSFDAAIVPSAKEMCHLAYKKYSVGDFEDVAYFEPYYLKDFIGNKITEK